MKVEVGKADILNFLDFEMTKNGVNPIIPYEHIFVKENIFSL